MKRLIACWLLASALLMAQSQSTLRITRELLMQTGSRINALDASVLFPRVAVDPSGSCSEPGAVVISQASDSMFWCDTTWKQVAGGGAGGGLSEPNSNGIVVRTSAGNVAARTITGGTGISCNNGDGVSGNPTCSADTSVLQTRENSQGQQDNVITDAGGDDTYDCTTTASGISVPAPPPTGSRWVLIPSTANTGAATCGGSSILRANGDALADGDIPAGRATYLVRHSASIWRLEQSNGTGGSSGGVTSATLATLPGTCAPGDVRYVTDATPPQIYHCPTTNNWAATQPIPHSDASITEVIASGQKQLRVTPNVYMERANNLSDVASAATARSNLGLGDAATKNTGTAAGTVAAGDHTHAGGGYATIQDEGTPATQRAALNFTGSGVSCVDNAGQSRTDCTINSLAATNASANRVAVHSDGTGNFNAQPGGGAALTWNGYVLTVPGAFDMRIGGSGNPATCSSTYTMPTTLASAARINLTGNCTLSDGGTNGTAIFIVEICQDGTGGHTVTWPARFKGTMTVSSAANTCSVQQFISNNVKDVWHAVTPGVTGQ